MQITERTGSSDEYRYGFQGQEKDDEIKGEGNSLNYTFRMHDPRIGRFFAVDPLFKEYPELSPFQFASNSPIDMIEIEGMEGGWIVNAQYEATYMKGPAVANIFDSEQVARRAASLGVRLPKDLARMEKSYADFLSRIPKVQTPVAQFRCGCAVCIMNGNRDQYLGGPNSIGGGIGIGMTEVASDVAVGGVLKKVGDVYKVFKTYKQSKIATKALSSTAKISDNIYYGAEFIDDGLRMVDAPLQLKSTKIDKMVDKVFTTKAQHVINGSNNSVHNWETLVPDKNPEKIKAIIKSVLENGTDVAYKRGQAKSMQITVNGVTKEVQVPYIKGQNGDVENFSTAFVK